MKTIIVGVTLALGMATPAFAQATGASVPGGGDASRMSNNNRMENSSYNHVVSNMDPVKQGEAPKVAPVRNAKPAKPGDIVAGSALRDVNGVPVGKVETIEADGAVISSGGKKVKVPLTAFGKDDSGLLIAVTQAKLNELIAKVSSAQ